LLHETEDLAGLLCAFSDFQNFLLFFLEDLVDLEDIRIRQLLELFFRLLDGVLGLV
jgi:hypothetical protein